MQYIVYVSPSLLSLLDIVLTVRGSIVVIYSFPSPIITLKTNEALKFPPFPVSHATPYGTYSMMLHLMASLKEVYQVRAITVLYIPIEMASSLLPVCVCCTGTVVGRVTGSKSRRMSTR